jgi:hypothetical protein
MESYLKSGFIQWHWQIAMTSVCHLGCCSGNWSYEAIATYPTWHDITKQSSLVRNLLVSLCIKILDWATSSQTLWAYVPPLMWETKFHRTTGKIIILFWTEQ